MNKHNSNPEQNKIYVVSTERTDGATDAGKKVELLAE